MQTNRHGIRVNQPVSYYTTVLVRTGIHSSVDSCDTSNCGQQGHNHSVCSQVAILDRERTPDNHASSADNRRGETDQERLESVEAETRDDKRTKAGQTAVWKLREDNKGKNQPGLDVLDGMPHLVVLPLVALDSHHVLSHSLDGHDLLLVGQELGLVGRLGHEEEPQEADDDGEEAEHEEDVHPGLQSRVCYVTQAVGEQAGHDREQALHGCPQHGAQDLLATGVEHGCVKDEARCHD